MASPSLSVIVPTFREKANLPIVVSRLEDVLRGFCWEVIFVDDDSDDGSDECLMSLARTHANVRFIRRFGRRGLASACIEGMGASSADFFAVMDADLQHDEQVLPQMVAALRDDPTLDLVVGSRYVEGGGFGNWNWLRRNISQWATTLEKKLLRAPLSDPMSGFFVLRREVFEESVRHLTGRGFKILLDIVLSCRRQLKFREIPFQFRNRQHGESKLDLVVGLEYLYLLADKTLGKFLPLSFVLYLMAGLSGLFLHLCVLSLLFVGAGLAFWEAQTMATALAMISNFLLNNSVTFQSRRLRGTGFLIGLVTYMAICSMGAVVNVQSASFLFENAIPWWFAGSLGALVGAVWNYAVSTQIVWTWLPSLLSQLCDRSKTRSTPT